MMIALYKLHFFDNTSCHYIKFNKYKNEQLRSQLKTFNTQLYLFISKEASTCVDVEFYNYRGNN